MNDTIIVYYHRVVDEPPPDEFQLLSRYGLHVDVERFGEQMEFLARHYRVVPLDELVRSLDERTPASPLAAVTFDDGYVDNYTHALPVLQRVGVPATVFVTTGCVGTGAPYWWDRLARHVSLNAGKRLAVPASLEGMELTLDSPERIGEAFVALHGRMKALDGPTRDALLDAMGADAAPGPARPMTWDDARHMAAAGISIGAHSVSHPSLVSISDPSLRDEIARCRDEIAIRIGAAPSTFSYPFGDADDRVARAVEAAGLSAAVTVRAGVCDLAPSRYLLPRVWIPDVGREGFRAVLERNKRASEAARRRALLRRVVPPPLRAARRYLTRVWRGRLRA